MTPTLFIGTMRTNRGRLSAKHTVDNMTYIADNATDDFINYMLTTKKLGVDKASDIVRRLTAVEQNELIMWLDTKPGNIAVHSIEMRIIKVISERLLTTTSGA